MMNLLSPPSGQKRP